MGNNSNPKEALKIQKGQSKQSTTKQITASDICNQLEIFYTHPQNVKLTISDFKILGRVGEGGLGEVYLAECQNQFASKMLEQKYFAMHRVPKSLLMNRKISMQSRIQKSILNSINTKFILSRLYALQDENQIYFVTKYAKGGNTYTLFQNKSLRRPEYKALGEKAVKFILACVILGLQQLHSKNIIYSNLKPQHVFIKSDGYIILKELVVSQREAGTLFYFAPQMMMKNPYDRSIDLWMLGIYAYQISVLRPPFTYDQIKQNRGSKIKLQKLILEAEANRDWKKSNLTPELKSFISQLLKLNPQERLGYKDINEIKSHPFFQNFDWQSLENFEIKSPLLQIILKHPSEIMPVDIKKQNEQKEQNQFRQIEQKQ